MNNCKSAAAGKREALYDAENQTAVPGVLVGVIERCGGVEGPGVGRPGSVDVREDLLCEP
jgi:hypothetical protein